MVNTVQKLISLPYELSGVTFQHIVTYERWSLPVLQPYLLVYHFPYRSAPFNALNHFYTASVSQDKPPFHAKWAYDESVDQAPEKKLLSGIQKGMYRP